MGPKMKKKSVLSGLFGFPPPILQKGSCPGGFGCLLANFQKPTETGRIFRKCEAFFKKKLWQRGIAFLPQNCFVPKHHHLLLTSPVESSHFWPKIKKNNNLPKPLNGIGIPKTGRHQNLKGRKSSPRNSRSFQDPPPQPLGLTKVRLAGNVLLYGSGSDPRRPNMTSQTAGTAGPAVAQPGNVRCWGRRRPTNQLAIPIYPPQFLGIEHRVCFLPMFVVPHPPVCAAARKSHRKVGTS